MLELLPSVLLYSLISCLAACGVGLLMGWLGFQFNFTVGMLLSGLLGFAFATGLVFWSFRVSGANIAWAMLVPLFFGTWLFTVGYTWLFYEIFKYTQGEILENATAAQIAAAPKKPLFFKLGPDTYFDTAQSIAYFDGFACLLVDKNLPDAPPKLWFNSFFPRYQSPEENKKIFMEVVAKLKTQHAFFTYDYRSLDVMQKYPQKEFGAKPIAIIGTDEPQVKAASARKYLFGTLVGQNLLLVVLSLLLSQIVLRFVNNLNA